MPCRAANVQLTETQKVYTKCTFLTPEEVLRVDKLLQVLDEDESGEVDAVELHCQPLTYTEVRYLAIWTTCTVSSAPKVWEQVPLAWCSRSILYNFVDTFAPVK